MNQRNGVRWTTAKAFLRPARSRANLRVITGALVSGLVVEGRVARSLRYRIQ